MSNTESADPLSAWIKMLKDPKLKRAVRLAHRAEWRIEVSKHGLLVYPPDGTTRPIAVHRTNRSDGHGRRTNPLVQFRRAGLDI